MNRSKRRAIPGRMLSPFLAIGCKRSPTGNLGPLPGSYQPHSLGWGKRNACELRAKAPNHPLVKKYEGSTRFIEKLGQSGQLRRECFGQWPSVRNQRYNPSCFDYQKLALFTPDYPDSSPPPCASVNDSPRVKPSPQSRLFGAFVPRVQVKVIGLHYDAKLPLQPNVPRKMLARKSDRNRPTT